MSHATAPIDFRANTQRVPPQMPAAVQKATSRFLAGRAALVEALGAEAWEQLRQAGHDLRLHTVAHLDHYLEQAERQVIEAGGHVHWALDAEEACRIVIEIAGQHGVKRAVKAKSMATEEIGLNRAMQAAGIQVLETDLGEDIATRRRRARPHRRPRVLLVQRGDRRAVPRKVGRRGACGRPSPHRDRSCEAA